ncbi:DNA-binding IclR family transcriptional regulator [Kineosphaera limosa]|uniref:IclR family transcriptional regulator n=1 Tax=Kineosphaera limosa TaxID=111564 RepID=UPI00180C57BC|nr:IclR family transcriptional regulator [Kineosphaera limosa]NYE01914.1 DNA-binding IclR family transcriptional regulator [Kineosphaera limosa]
MEKALQIITLVAQRPMSASEISRELDTHRSTISRLVRTLEEHRFVRRDRDGTVRLGSFLTTLPSHDLRRQELIDAARPHLEALGERFGHTVHLAGLEGNDIVYWDKVESRQVLRMYSTIGARAPAHATGVGKAILALLPPARRARVLETGELTRHTEHTIVDREQLEEHLAEIAHRGWAVDALEHEPFIHCVAAPICGANGVVGAVSVTAPQVLVPREELLAMVPDLVGIAAQITTDIGGNAP